MHETQHLRMSHATHVSHMSMSCHTYERVMSHIYAMTSGPHHPRTAHVTYMKHIRMSHATHVSHMSMSCHTYERVMSRIYAMTSGLHHTQTEHEQNMNPFLVTHINE